MDPVALSTMIGAVSPILLAVLVQSHWSARTKLLIVFGVCAGLGLEVAASAGQLHTPRDAADVATVMADVAAVLVACQAVYMGLKKAGVIDAVAARTDVTKPAAPVVPPAVPSEPQRPFGNS